MMLTSQSQATQASSASPLDTLTRLLITEQIRSLKATYTRLLDTQQWDELAALFVDDARFTLANFGEPLVFENKQDWIRFVTPLLSGGTTVHQIHQGEIDVLDIDTVTARWAMTDYVVPAAASGRTPFWGHGHYTERYRRVGEFWKVTSLELSRLMLSGAGDSGLPMSFPAPAATPAVGAGVL